MKDKTVNSLKKDLFPVLFLSRQLLAVGNPRRVSKKPIFCHGFFSCEQLKRFSRISSSTNTPGAYWVPCLRIAQEEDLRVHWD